MEDVDRTTKLVSKKNLLAKYLTSSIACEVGCVIICTCQLSRKLHGSIVLFNVFSKLSPCLLSTIVNLFELAPPELANILESHYIAEKSLFYSQESILLVIATLMGKGRTHEQERTRRA
jgi:hypothetical protein